jgi:Flp pilus assembly protein TadB
VIWWWGLLAATAAATAAGLALGPPGPRLRTGSSRHSRFGVAGAVSGPASPASVSHQPESVAAETGPGQVRATATGAIAAVSVWVVVGGVVGLGLAAGVGLLARRQVAGMATRPQLRRRENLAAWTPFVADMLADLVQAGAAPDVACADLGRVGGHPLARDLLLLAERRRLGATGPQSCVELIGASATRRLGTALARSMDEGASPVDSLRAYAHEARADQRLRGEQACRRLSSLVALPLGLTMLPAFVLVAIVPLVLGGLMSALDAGLW